MRLRSRAMCVRVCVCVCVCTSAGPKCISFAIMIPMAVVGSSCANVMSKYVSASGQLSKLCGRRHGSDHHRRLQRLDG